VFHWFEHCSERSALLQLRMKHYSKIESLYITADSDTIITPGLLCREMLCEFLTLDTPIVLASHAPQQSPVPYDVQIATLRELFPYPSIFLNVPGSTVADFARHFHSTAEKPAMRLADKAEWLSLYRDVVTATAKDGRPTLHPMRYAAGVLFSDGSHQVQAMTKLLEYGWSLDAVVKLVPSLEERRERGVSPVVLFLADHCGNLHSLSAPARSHLSEYGYSPALLFHDRSGKLVETTVQSLAPDVPDAISDALPLTVTQSAASTHECAAMSPHTH
jgi:hypothetical protein